MSVIAHARIELEVHDDLRTCTTLAVDVSGATLNLEEEYGPFDRLSDVLHSLAVDLEVFLEDVAGPSAPGSFREVRLPLRFDEK